MATSQSGPSLSALPPELRIKILRYALRNEGDPIHPRLRVKSNRKFYFPGHLLGISKDLKPDAAAVLYSENKFLCADLYDAWTFLLRIGTINCNYIRELNVGRLYFRREEGSEIECKATEEIAQRCGNLTKLTIGTVVWAERKGSLRIAERYRDLIATFPRLPHVYYAAVRHELVLLAEPMQDKEKNVSWTYALIDRH